MTSTTASLLFLTETKPPKHENRVTSHTFKDKENSLIDTGKVCGEIQGSSNTCMKNSTTLGDGGLKFQPAPESGQMSGRAPLDSTSAPHVREEKVPLYVWKQKECCKDYRGCLSHSEEAFGYVPLTDLKVYTGPPVSGIRYLIL